MFLHADGEDSDQTGRMSRLIWVYAGRTCNFVGFVMLRLNLWQSKSENLYFCFIDQVDLRARCPSLAKCSIKDNTNHYIMSKHVDFHVSDYLLWIWDGAKVSSSTIELLCSRRTTRPNMWFWYRMERGIISNSLRTRCPSWARDRTDFFCPASNQ